MSGTASSIAENTTTAAWPSSTLAGAEKQSESYAHGHPEDVEPIVVEQSAKQNPGLHWSEDEVQEIPYNNKKIVVPALMITTFLSVLDQTIAAVSLPKIVEDIGSESGYSWVGSAYLLMSSCFNPLYGKFSDTIGRKPILFFSIGVFLFGSALCGAAQSFIWLARCRGVQGIGAGGCMQMTMITMSDITSLQERSRYIGLMGATMGIASVIGPLLGGALTDHASWRWCIWINLPLAGLAIILFFFFLHLNPVKKRTVREAASSFDFVGLSLLMSGIVLFLFGLEDANTASGGWHAPQTLAPLIIGVVLLTSGLINEGITNREPIIPPRLFKTRTTAGCLISVFIHSFVFFSVVFFSVVYYTPLYFQIRGSSATMAGVRQLPLPIGAAIMSMGTGMMLPKTGKYRPVLWAGGAIMTLGIGLLIMLDEKTSVVKQEVLLFVFGIGVGCLFQTPLIALQAAMPLKDMATNTATYQLLRTLGGTVSISIGNTIFQSELAKRLKDISVVPSPNSNLPDFTSISHIQPDSLRQQITHALTRSIATIFIAFTPVSFVSLLLLLTVRQYSLKRNFERAPRQDSRFVSTDPPPMEANLKDGNP
ncbi:hypothetical protein ACEPAG_8157 [Sanghuangporus baumii]